MPPALKINCRVCDRPLDPLMASLAILSHPACNVPGVEVVELPEEAPPAFTRVNDAKAPCPLPEVAAEVQAQMTTMVRMFEQFDARSQQLSLGPSDLGTECDRNLGYKIMGLRGANFYDPWPAFVGSAIHHRMGEVITAHAAEVGGAWLIEEKVIVDPLISGHADLTRGNLVVDLKSAGPDAMKKIAKEGPPHKYLVQLNCYAKGLRDAGHPVDTIVFVFLPRSGWLTSMYVWAAPYDEALATSAIARAYAVGRLLGELDVQNFAHRWEQVPATPGDACIWCPMYDKHRPPERGADDKGCPGKNGEKKRGRKSVA
jgi:hypothetical protein